MVKVKEKQVDGKMQLVVTEDTLINRIKAVCDKVEKAQDAYKSIAEDVYLLKKYGAHKAAGYSNFKDYITAVTGMGKTTATSLVKIWGNRLVMAKEFDRVGFDQGIIDQALGWYDSLGMRALLSISKTEIFGEFLSLVTGVGSYDALETVLDDALTSVLQRSSIEEKEAEPSEEKEAEPSEGKEAEPSEGKGVETSGQIVMSPKVTVEINSDQDLDELVETLSKLYDGGYRLEVTYCCV